MSMKAILGVLVMDRSTTAGRLDHIVNEGLDCVARCTNDAFLIGGLVGHL